MALEQVFNPTDWTTLEGGKEISRTLPVGSNMQGFYMENFSPYTFTIMNESGHTILNIMGYCIATGNWSQTSRQIIITSQSQYPQISSGQTATNNFSLEFTTAQMASQVVALPVTAGKLIAEISNSTLNVQFPSTQSVDANITNSTLNVEFPSTQSVDANITNSTLDVTFPNAQDVNINNTSIPVTNVSGGNLTVAGTVDANIKNASIDTQSTIINEQVVTGTPVQSIVTVDIPAESAAPAGVNSTQSLLPSNNMINLGLMNFSLVSKAGYNYQIYFTAQTKFSDGTVLDLFQNSSPYNLSSGSTGYGTSNPMQSVNWGQVYTCNSLVASITQTTSATQQFSDTVTIYLNFDGNASVDLTSLNAPATNQIAYQGGGAGLALVSSTAPLPVFPQQGGSPNKTVLYHALPSTNYSTVGYTPVFARKIQLYLYNQTNETIYINILGSGNQLTTSPLYSTAPSPIQIQLNAHQGSGYWVPDIPIPQDFQVQYHWSTAPTTGGLYIAVSESN